MKKPTLFLAFLILLPMFAHSQTATSDFEAFNIFTKKNGKIFS
jgi:hypothetical protein